MPEVDPPPLPFGTGEWQLDAEIVEAVVEEDAPPAVLEFPRLVPQKPAPVAEKESPPPPEQIIEAMLFLGGHPLTCDVARRSIRGLTPEHFQDAVDALNRRYRKHGRPYVIQPRDDGFVLAILAPFRPLREKLFGGPREARLNQAAIDVLSVVAYRQPVGKSEIDAIRGTDSGGTLRQLVRFGLIAVQHRADAENREVRYGTTRRFLTTFGLGGLDELPRLGETAPV
ncbi:MAG: SMC-Scp complex subunit ScpB [Gemmataceae bacterium]